MCIRDSLAALTMSVAISVVMAVIAVLFRRELMSLFNSDPQVIEIGARYLLIVSSFYVCLLYTS